MNMASRTHSTRSSSDKANSLRILQGFTMKFLRSKQALAQLLPLSDHPPTH